MTGEIAHTTWVWKANALCICDVWNLHGPSEWVSKRFPKLVRNPDTAQPGKP